MSIIKHTITCIAAAAVIISAIFFVYDYNVKEDQAIAHAPCEEAVMIKGSSANESTMAKLALCRLNATPQK